MGLIKSNNNTIIKSYIGSTLLQQIYLGGPLTPNIYNIPNTFSAPTSLVTSSSEFDSLYPNWEAFSGGTGNGWSSTSIAPPHWIKRDVTSEVTSGDRLKSYSITPGSTSTTYDIKAWQMQVSTTGLFTGEQSIVDTRSNESFTGVVRQFSISNPQLGEYIRLYITEVNGGATSEAWIDTILLEYSSPSNITLLP